MPMLGKQSADKSQAQNDSDSDQYDDTLVASHALDNVAEHQAQPDSDSDSDYDDTLVDRQEHIENEDIEESQEEHIYADPSLYSEMRERHTYISYFSGLRINKKCCATLTVIAALLVIIVVLTARQFVHKGGKYSL